MINKKSPGARGIPQPFKQQAGHAPQFKPAVAQLKTGVSVQSVKGLVAPPVYRPQVKPGGVQAKMAGSSQLKNHPIALPVYHPQPVPKVLQTKQNVSQHASQRREARQAAFTASRPPQTNRVAQAKVVAAPQPHRPSASIPPTQPPQATSRVHPPAKGSQCVAGIQRQTTATTPLSRPAVSVPALRTPNLTQPVQPTGGMNNANPDRVTPSRPTHTSVVQRVLDIQSSTKSPINELKYGDFKSLNRRYKLPIPTWLCLKELAALENNLKFDNWREVISLINGVSVATETIHAHSAFYKGGGLTFKIEQKSDWSGCYLTDTLSLASGYGKVTNLTVTHPLQVVRVTGKFIGLGKIPSEIKANLIKNLLGISKNSKLIPCLGSQGKGYVGLENEEGEYETIVPWTILKSHFTWDGATH